MSYSIIGSGGVGSTLASYFAKAGIEVALANSRGATAVEPVAQKLGQRVVAKSLDDALKADVIVIAVPFLKFKDVASALPGWTGKIVIDVTNAYTLPAEAQEAEFGARTSSEANAKRVPGAKLVKAFNQLPVKDLAAPSPTAESASSLSQAMMKTRAQRSPVWSKTLGLRRSKSESSARAVV